MTNEGFKFQASAKDADGDMVNVRADSPAEFEAALLNFPAGAYAQFKANVRGGQALGQIVQPAPSQQAAPAWNNSPQQTQPQWSQPQQQAAPAQQGGGYQPHPNAQLHPEGKQCDQCGKTLEFKRSSGGKGKYQCPDWRWQNGNPNGHSMEWQN